MLVVLHLTDAPGDASAIFIIAENAFLACLCKPGADIAQFYDGNMDAVGLDFICQSITHCTAAVYTRAGVVALLWFGYSVRRG